MGAIPIRGESIGAAYVRILADGSGLPDSIEREVRKSSDKFEKAGGRNNESYHKGFDRQEKKNPSLRKIRNSLMEGSGEFESVGKFLGSSTMRGLESSLRDKFGKRLGNAMAADLRQQIADGLNPSELNKIIGGSGLRSLARRVTAELDKEDKVQLAHRKKFEEDLQNLMNKRVLVSNKMAEDFRRIQKKTADDWEKNWRKDTDKIGRETHKTLTGLKSELSTLGNNFRKTGDSMHRLKTTIIKDVDKFGREVGKTARSSSSLFRRMADDLDLAAKKIARPRNNFINFFASLGRAAVSGISLTLRTIDGLFVGVKKIGTEFGRAFSEVRAGGGGIFSALASGAGAGALAFGELAATAIPALAALAVGIIVLGPLVSIVSGLTAAVIALAGSLSFALIGAIAPLFGLIAPLGAALGVLALAFVGMGKKTRDALRAGPIKELTAAFKDLRAEAQKGLFKDLPYQVGLLGKAFGGLKPLIGAVARAVSFDITMMLRGLNSPGGQAFLRNMTKFLPVAIKDLGEILVHTFGGIAGLFVALEPVTQRFLDFMEKITFRFSKFTNSAKGRNQLRDFFERARQSAHDLWQLLGAIGGLLGTLFSAGKTTGDNIIIDMTKKIREFTDYLRANPRAMTDFFANGLSIARELGDTVLKISKLIASLDTPANRNLAKLIFGAMELAAYQLYAVTQLVQFTFKSIGFVGKAIFAGLVIVAAGFLDVLYGIVKVGALLHLPGFAKAADELKGVRDELAKFAKSLILPPVKVSTKKAHADIGALRNQVDGFRQPRPTLFKVIKKGLFSTDVGALRNQIDHFPKPAPTLFQVIRKALFSKDVGALRNQVDHFPKDHYTQMHVETHAALAGITALRVGIGSIHDKTVTITTRNKKVGSTSGSSANPTNNASGGIFGPIAGAGHLIRIAEVAGQPEAVVPLNRPLSQVDPAVRWLSAIAQGKVPGFAGGGVKGSGKTIDVGGIQVVTHESDPEAIATALLNRLVAFAY